MRELVFIKGCLGSVLNGPILWMDIGKEMSGEANSCMLLASIKEEAGKSPHPFRVTAPVT